MGGGTDRDRDNGSNQTFMGGNMVDNKMIGGSKRDEWLATRALTKFHKGEFIDRYEQGHIIDALESANAKLTRVEARVDEWTAEHTLDHFSGSQALEWLRKALAEPSEQCEDCPEMTYAEPPYGHRPHTKPSEQAACGEWFQGDGYGNPSRGGKFRSRCTLHKGHDGLHSGSPVSPPAPSATRERLIVALGHLKVKAMIHDPHGRAENDLSHAYECIADAIMDVVRGDR